MGIKPNIFDRISPVIQRLTDKAITVVSRILGEHIVLYKPIKQNKDYGRYGKDTEYEKKPYFEGRGILTNCYQLRTKTDATLDFNDDKAYVLLVPSTQAVYYNSKVLVFFGNNNFATFFIKNINTTYLRLDVHLYLACELVAVSGPIEKLENYIEKKDDNKMFYKRS